MFVYVKECQQWSEGHFISKWDDSRNEPFIHLICFREREKVRERERERERKEIVRMHARSSAHAYVCTCRCICVPMFTLKCKETSGQHMLQQLTQPLFHPAIRD